MMSIHSRSTAPIYHTAASGAVASDTRGGRSAQLALQLALVGLLLASAALGWSSTLVRSVPALERAFALAGLPVARRTPVLREVSSSVRGDVLVVTGKIVNPGDKPIGTPALRISVRAGDGREIYHWTAAAPNSRLGARQVVAFRAKLLDPPPNAVRVDVTFARTRS